MLGAPTLRRVVFFDLDGCLLDSTEPIMQCLNAALDEVGLNPIARDDLARHIGPPLQVTVARVLAEQDASEVLAAGVIAAYRERYRTVSLDLAVTYPGIPEMLAELAPVDRLGVCTSKPARWALPILRHLELDRYFELIAGPGLTEAEPKAETLARAIGDLTPLDQRASVMVGDRHHDIDAALHHGLVPIGVSWGFGSREELEAAGALVVVDDVDELAGTIVAEL